MVCTCTQASPRWCNPSHTRCIGISSPCRLQWAEVVQPAHAGTAVAVRPTPEMMAAADDTAAQAVLAAEPEAVAAYDHVPVRAGAAVFTMDTASEVFMLHSGKVGSAA